MVVEPNNMSLVLNSLLTDHVCNRKVMEGIHAIQPLVDLKLIVDQLEIELYAPVQLDTRVILILVVLQTLVLKAHVEQMHAVKGVVIGLFASVLMDIREILL